MRTALTLLVLCVFCAGTASAQPYAYVTNNGSDNVSVIGISTNTVVATVAVGSEPSGVAVSPDGKFVYVTNAGADNISVIQTSDNTVIGTWDGGDN